jgi:hypothetical protein
MSLRATLTPHTMHPLHRRMWQPYPKWAPWLMRSLPKLRVARQNWPVGSESPRATRERDKVTQRVASIWCIQGPIKGDMASSSIISESWQGGFLHTPPCGLAPSRPGFLARDYSAKALETTWPRFDQGGISPYLILWRRTCPGWLWPTNGDPSSTQILILCYSQLSQNYVVMVNVAVLFESICSTHFK